LAAAAITAAKIATAGGVGAYGLKKLIGKSKPPELNAGPHDLSPVNPGDRNETAENSVR
jgi:hypothetical protein